MPKNYIAVAAIFAGLAVALGAFGAHGLESITKDARPDDPFGQEKILHGFHTAVEYQLYHALALLSIGIFSDRLLGSWLKRAGACFITGIILFSGSLYLLTFFKIQGSSAVKFLGPVTPIDGIILIVGWLCLLIAAVKKS